ncbi:DotI/IcmL family type IV secretion protein [Legionella bononiensis]|uniref:DotI/IcmL family type IV secretion protein n=1 Tax=Legionella bononiensis TaxID=2793102 RepID=A0ABS1WDN9_9GAMM|nr:DotI/IcmL family type IV secretion protein [Legionella bononiensis]MBL7481442.1 DotI/IcmL family type IV secretion protein [Legionella bononiensis]MBL7527474.1 DotI/IcmL family type IV secretion protein [Legionella bononiensis]
MNKLITLAAGIVLFLAAHTGIAAPDRTQLAVWANEAIIATYTFDYKNYLQQQKEIAKYFTSDGWIAYTKALNESKLPEAVQKNSYEVTAVATQPPVLTTLDPTHWQATMTVLVVYKNPQYQQQQNLKVVLSFIQAPAGQGVRGFAVTSLQARVTEPPCECKIPENENSTQKSDKQ